MLLDHNYDKKNGFKDIILPTMSSFLLVGECLLDVRRVKIFKEAIERIVKPGDIVVDAGTGTGIMALFAANAGAQKVFAIELDPDIAKIARRNVKANHRDNIIKVLNQDAATFIINGRRPANVLIMEMLDTGLIAEHQAITIASLKENGVIDSNTQILPEKVNLGIRAIDYDFNFYGFHLPSIIQARNYGVGKKIRKWHSNLQSYGIIEFRLLTSTKFGAKISLQINQSGIVNAVELKTDIYLAGKKYSGTSDMNIPVIIPIKEREVVQHDVLDLYIKYHMGNGFGNVKIV
jgi:predicted RNA methylase